MADIAPNLWEFNLTRVIIVDVSDDYRLMQPPLPSDCYPVLLEAWLPSHNLSRSLPTKSLVDGYLYDWHEKAEEVTGSWYVGVVSAELAKSFEIQA